MYMRSFDNLFLESKWIASIWRVYNWGKNFQHLKVLYKNSASKIQLGDVMFNFFRERLSKYESVEEPGCPDRNPTPPQMWEERQKSQQPLKVVVGDNNNNKNLGLILVWTSNSFAPGYKRYVSKLFQMRRPLFVWAKTNKGLIETKRKPVSVNGVLWLFGEALLYLKCSTADIYSNKRRERGENVSLFSIRGNKQRRKKEKLGFAFQSFSHFKERMERFHSLKKTNGKWTKVTHCRPLLSLYAAIAVF